MKLIIDLCLRHPRALLITVILAVVAGIITAPVPYLSKLVIDDYLFRDLGAVAVGDSLWSMLGMVALLIAVGIGMKSLGAIIVGWQNYFILKITRDGLFEERLRMVRRIFGAKQSFFESNEPGRIASRAATDMFQIDGTIWTMLRQVLSNAFLVVVIVVFMLAMNPVLTAVILVTLPITALVTVVVFQKMREFNSEESDRAASLSATCTEVFSGIKVIRTFNAEPFFLRKIEACSEALRYHGHLHWTVFHTLNSLVVTFSSFGADLFLLAGGYLALTGQITFGEFFAFSAYQGMLWGPVNVLLASGALMQAGIASAGKVQELNEVEQEPYLLHPNPHQPPSFEGRIEAQNLTFYYHPDEPVLRDLTFALKPGTMTALVGQSGSGKTTLASLLLGLHLPSGGSLMIDGVDVREWDLRALRSHVGVVLQDAILFNDTLRANLTLGREDITDDRIWAALALAHLDDTIRALPDRLNTKVGVSGARLSGGQKQRIAIARVFLKDPKLLILDEATSALDSETEKAIQRSFDALMAGRTSVVIAHRLSTIYKADQIMVLHQGRLVEMGTHDELAQRAEGHYRHLYEAQVEGMIPMSGPTRKPW